MTTTSLSRIYSTFLLRSFCRMSEKNDHAIVLINLYEENVNKPKRKKVLDGMLNHTDGHILAKCVFRRADSSVFLSARNELMPTRDGDENGPYDSILAPADCRKILRSLGYDDYVTTLLKDELECQYLRDADSLSSIPRIISEREKIRNGTAVSKFKTEEQRLSGVKIGTEWVRKNHLISFKYFF